MEAPGASVFGAFQSSPKGNGANLRRPRPTALWILPIRRIFVLNPDVMRHTLLTLVLLCGIVIIAFGKGSSLSGWLAGPDGKPLAGASIQLTKKGSTTPLRTMQTGSDGTY